MDAFRSESLDRTFDAVYFVGDLRSTGAGTAPAGEIPDSDHPSPTGIDRATGYALTAAREAWDQAGLDEADRARIGVALGTNFGGIVSGESHLDGNDKRSAKEG